MLRNLTIIISCALLATGIAASHVLPLLYGNFVDAQRQAVCWGPGILSGATGLAQQFGTKVFKTSLPSDMTQFQQDAVAKSMKVSLRNLGYAGHNSDAGTVSCSASIGYSYTRPDGTSFSKDDGSIITFELVPGSDGWNEEMNSASIPGDLLTYSATGTGE